MELLARDGLGWAISRSWTCNDVSSLIFSIITVMHIFRFSANFTDFDTKKVIFVNGLNLLRQFRGYGRGLRGVHNAYSGCFYETNR